MSGQIEITHGGAIAVDPEALRQVADSLFALSLGFADAAAAVSTALGHLSSGAGFFGGGTGQLAAATERCEALQAECVSGARSTLLMADVYELVELRAELAARTIRDDAAATLLLQARIAALTASDPKILEIEEQMMAQWEQKRFEGLDRQFDTSIFGPMRIDLAGLIFAAAAKVGAGVGPLAPGATLQGSGGPVRVSAGQTQYGIRPPTSLAEAFGRFPQKGSDAQLKVEKYTMPDGRNRFILYAHGTSSAGIGGKNPLDLKSNLELYTGKESASYAATVRALEEAGAEAGDRVDVWAHSQAAMNSAYLATQSHFDVGLQVTAGSPVHPTLEPGQQIIELRHTDDMVSALAGGGSPGGSGSADSMVVTRVGDPLPGVQDLALKTHWLGDYIDTAALLDASDDPRMASMEQYWKELAEAESVVSTEYVAERG
ncbi:hypothetical protein [Microbacterium sp. GXF6406]